jgi:hypothetical protein
MTGVFIVFDNESIPILLGDVFPHYSDRYTMRYCFSRLALGLCLLMLLWATTRASANETPGCADCPGGSAEATINVTFCSMGITYNVDVTYCTKTYSPPQVGLPCATNTGIDKYTVIKKICPSGTTLPPTDAATFTGVFCQLNPIRGDAFGWKPLIPYCDTAPNFFCWLVAFPRCTQRANGCIVVCNMTNPPCCITSIQYCRDRATGTYGAMVINRCSSTCESQCTDNGCAFDPNADCEVCP